MKFKQSQLLPVNIQKPEVSDGTSEAEQKSGEVVLEPKNVTSYGDHDNISNKGSRPIEIDKDQQVRIYQLAAQGMTKEAIAESERVTDDTVARVISKLSSETDMRAFKKGFGKMLMTGGVLATRKLIEKLNSPEADRANIGSLAVVAGICTDKALAALDQGEEPAPTIDWNDLLGENTTSVQVLPSK